MNDMIIEKDLFVIEKEMNWIILENLKIIREEIFREEVEQLFVYDLLKFEFLVDILQIEIVSIYCQSEFVDLCWGLYLVFVGQIKVFLFIYVLGVYWCGDSN